MALKIFQGGQIVLGNLIKTYKWAEKEKRDDLQYIENKKADVLRMNRLLSAYEQLAELPLDQDLIILPASAIDQLPKGLPFQRFCLDNPSINEIIKAAKNTPKGGGNEEEPKFEYGSPYYEGCEQFNSWLNKPTKAASDFTEAEKWNQLVDYEKAKIYFKKIMGNKLFLDGDKKFKVNGNNMAIIPELLKYFIRDPSSKIDLNKSIFLFGNTGSGKDLLIKCFQRLLEEFSDHDAFIDNTTLEIYRKIKNKQQETIYYEKNRCFMDLGYEQKYFYKESEMPIMEEILFVRNERNTNNLLRTHVTSNIRFDKIGKLYNERIAARATQLWTPVWLNGPSLR